MGKYGIGAVQAANLVLNEGKDPPEAWAERMKELFEHSPTGEKKPCPKGAFLGLCEAGLVLGIEEKPDGTWDRSPERLNKGYAIEIVDKLKHHPEYLVYLNMPQKFWDKLRDEKRRNGLDWPETENGQPDVVFALWNERLISR